MVPYVRKSFYKHFKDGIKYLTDIENFDNDKKVDSANISIEDEMYHKYGEKVYKYALDLTEREINQSVEAMYHNLNSLQSRAGRMCAL